MADHDWRTVALDVTGHCDFSEGDRDYVKGIYDVYMYDHNERTFCCELTPSYYLVHLYTTIVFVDNIRDATRERLDETYCHIPTDDCYMHVSSVERIKVGVASYGQDATEEEAREYWQGNPVF